MTDRDIAWLAGILEGEGHFGYMAYTARVDLWMSDRDVIERAATLLGKKVARRNTMGRKQWKPLYGFTVCGALAIGLMFTIYTLLGSRRRQQIAGALAKWRAPRLSHAERSRISSAAAQRVAKRLGPLHYRDMGRKGNAARYGVPDTRTGDLYG